MAMLRCRSAHEMHLSEVAVNPKRPFCLAASMAHPIIGWFKAVKHDNHL